jgi:hypothetical protein
MVLTLLWSKASSQAKHCGGRIRSSNNPVFLPATSDPYCKPYSFEETVRAEIRKLSILIGSKCPLTFLITRQRAIRMHGRTVRSLPFCIFLPCLLRTDLLGIDFAFCRGRSHRKEQKRLLANNIGSGTTLGDSTVKTATITRPRTT